MQNIDKSLLYEIHQLIKGVKAQVASYTNSALVMTYWKIGDHINQDILKNSKAEYGEGLIKYLSQELTNQYGGGFDIPNLSRMVRFSKIYSDQTIVVTLSQQLSWSHFVRLISIEDPLKREFYTQMCKIERWSVRALREKVNTLLYERTAISKQPEKLIKSEIEKVAQGGTITPDFYFQDPYILNFLYAKSISSERELEGAILLELQKFIQELGTDFCFMARQKRMSTGKNDRFLDLLFFHRGLRRLIAIELKLGQFQPEHAGQMEWYLKWLDKYERRSGEETPLGIIICADKDQEDIELLELKKNGIHVAQYLAGLPPKSIFTEKLHKAIEYAKEKHAITQD